MPGGPDMGASMSMCSMKRHYNGTVYKGSSLKSCHRVSRMKPIYRSITTRSPSAPHIYTNPVDLQAAGPVALNSSI